MDCCAWFDLDAAGRWIAHPPWLCRLPHPYRTYAAYFILETEKEHHEVLLGDEMGLGQGGWSFEVP